MKKITIIIIAILLVTACNSKDRSSTDDYVKTININLAEHTLEFSSIFKDVKYILLDIPNDSFLIGDIDKMKVQNEELFLLSSRSIVSYNIHDGSAILSLKRQGNAPDEYTSISDMWIDDSIDILDPNEKRIKIYDRKGNFLFDMKIPTSAYSFFKIDHSNYFLYNSNMLTDENHHRLIHFNTESQKVENKYFPIDENMATYFFVMEFSIFNTFNNAITFFSNPDHVVHTVSTDKQPIAKYKLDFGKHTAPEAFFENKFENIADFSDEAYKREYIYFVNNFAENSRYIALSFIGGTPRGIYLTIYDKQNDQNQTGCFTIDDIKFPKNKFRIDSNYCFTVDEDNCYFLIQPDIFIETINHYKKELGELAFNDFLNTNKDIKTILNSTGFNEHSNPILVICKF